MKKKLLIFFAANIFCFYNLFSAWYSNWAFREMVTFNNAVSSDLTNFPVLLNISNHHFLKYCTGSNGNDLSFTLVDGSTKLDHEIEYFNKTTGQVWAWIRMPILDSAEADSNKIYMYYDITQTGDQQNAAYVWGSNYLLKMHMTGNINDSGPFNTISSIVGDTAYTASGKIFGGCSFDGVNDGILFTQSLIPSTGNFTLSGWIKTPVSADQVFISQYNGTESGKFNFYANYNTVGYSARMYLEGATPSTTVLGGTIPLNDGNWHYISATRAGTDFKLYIDGGQNKNSTTTGVITAVTETTIGLSRTNGWDFTGVIDEVTIMTNCCSSNWIATEFSNQAAPLNFRSLGSLECGTRGIKIGGTITGAVSNNIAIIISNTVYYTTNSAADGTWEVIVPTGDYTITCESNGYLSIPAQYCVSPDATNLNYNFTVIQGKTLSGTVRDTCGIGIKNTTVNLTGSMSQNTISDTLGYYTFTVSNGIYAVSFSRDGYISSSLSEINISTDSLTNDIVLYDAYTVTGTITPAARGIVIKCLGASQTQTTETDENGLYLFTVTGGFYSVYPLVSNLASQPDKYSMQITANKTGCNFNLFQMKYAVSGYVTDIYGKPQEKIAVLPNNNIMLAVNTDENGFYCFYLTNGTHTVALAENGKIFTDNLKKNINVAGTGLSNINFILDYSLQDNTGSFIFSKTRLINCTDGKYNISFYKSLEGLHLCKITLMDPRGKCIEKLYDGTLAKGFYSYDVKNISRLKTGIYILQMRIQTQDEWKQYGRIFTVIK